MINFGKTKYIQKIWLKDKFTGDVLIIFNSRELVNKIIRSQMGLEHFVKTLGAKFFYAIGINSRYPSLEDFKICDEPVGVIWKSFETRDSLF